MTYRTRTYIAAEWDGDSDAVQQLHKWNDSNHFSLSFTDVNSLKNKADSACIGWIMLYPIFNI